jgi:hypothetical protein
MRAFRFARLALVPAAVVACDASSPPPASDAPTPKDAGADTSPPWPVHDDAGADASDDADASDASPARFEDMAPHLGFVDVPPIADGTARARMFYQFRPADDRDASRPLIVLMNGGPGSATSATLLPFGTGPTTLVDGQGSEAVGNPASWTRFGALLHIDSREAGFSYMLGPEPLPAACDALEEAGEHLLTVLRVLAKTKTRTSRRVILVGESYAGIRALAMRHLLLNPENTKSPELRAAILDHFGSAFVELGVEERRRRVRPQFGEFVFVQAAVVDADFQIGLQSDLVNADPVLRDANLATQSRYDVRKPKAWEDALTEQVAAAYSDTPTRGLLLAAPLESAPALLPGSRTSAARSETDQDVAALEAPLNRALERAYGPLASGDYYWTSLVSSCVRPRARAVTESWFIEALRGGARMFITHARYDRVIHSPAIVRMLQSARWLTVTVDNEPRAGVARPGWFSVTPDDGPTTLVRFPTYESGHMVTVGAPTEFAEDLEAWVAEGASGR